MILGKGTKIGNGNRGKWKFRVLRKEEERKGFEVRRSKDVKGRQMMFKVARGE